MTHMSNPLIVIAEDDRNHRIMLKTHLAELGLDICEISNGKNAVERSLQSPEPDLILMDIRMPIMDGNAALKLIKEKKPEIPVIMMTAFSEVAEAVEAIKLGAYDYLVKPLDMEKLKISINNALCQANLAKENKNLIKALKSTQKDIFCSSPAMHKLKDMLLAVAPTEVTVLISGESGTGKELVAKEVHANSKRANGPFIAVNCGAFSEGLLTSELFGHEKGSFTGADRKHLGLFQEAKGGTIFLDEIGEMPLTMQVKLLRVLQEREVLSVGAQRPEAIDCRILAATNRDLKKDVEQGKFREDLYYRLNVMNLHLPPLRQRKEDIPGLAEGFASRFSRQYNKIFKAISKEAMERLTLWNWPGNVRELENTIERAVILMTNGFITEAHLPDHFNCNEDDDNVNKKSAVTFFVNNPTLEEVERAAILSTLKQCGNNKSEAAKKLGISRKTLYARLGDDLKLE